LKIFLHSFQESGALLFYHSLMNIKSLLMHLSNCKNYVKWKSTCMNYWLKISEAICYIFLFISMIPFVHLLHTSDYWLHFKMWTDNNVLIMKTLVPMLIKSRARMLCLVKIEVHGPKSFKISGLGIEGWQSSGLISGLWF